jgi:hypothetical protein
MNKDAYLACFHLDAGKLTSSGALYDSPSQPVIIV